MQVNPPLDEKEAKARIIYVLHEQGYTYFNIPKLTWVEIRDLFRGGMLVEKERADRVKMQTRASRFRR